jgi:hypothetical protein
MHFKIDFIDPSKMIPVTAADLTLLIIPRREQERGSDMHFKIKFVDPSKMITIAARLVRT